jgi:5'-methylthioadenosine phosphorylase
MEGPAFSTRAESNLYRTWGADIIGMTALPEAKLAREAEMCFAVLACSTDYDCWHDSHEDVTADMIVANLLQNVDVSRRAVRAALQRLPEIRTCACVNALETAIVTSLDIVPPETQRRLEPIIGKYVQQKVTG